MFVLLKRRTYVRLIEADNEHMFVLKRIKRTLSIEGKRSFEAEDPGYFREFSTLVCESE